MSTRTAGTGSFRQPLRVEPSKVLGAHTGPAAPGTPRVAVVVSLTFPGITEATHALMERFTRTALDELAACGAHAELIDSAAERFTPESRLAEFDGVLFLGGGDVDARIYGHLDPVPNSYGVDRRADDYCLSLLSGVLDRDQPLLAICRGSQLLNVACGGTLIPDLEPYKLHHGGPGEPIFLDETITLLAGTRVRQIMGRQEIKVRSGHHQAVGRVAGELRVAAKARDGVVEATEHPGKRWVVGVQWHPEDSDGNSADRSRIFSAFVTACRRESDVRQQPSLQA